MSLLLYVEKSYDFLAFWLLILKINPTPNLNIVLITQDECKRPKQHKENYESVLYDQQRV